MIEEQKQNPTPAGAPPITLPKDTVEDLQHKIELLKQERDEYLNGWRRAKADLENYKKEELRRAEEVIKFGNVSLLKELLSIVDSFDLAMKSASGAEQKGIAMIQSQLFAMLPRNGLQPIISLGEIFDPKVHEAMSEKESDKPEGTVLEEVTRGWKLYDRVVRPAKVIISKFKEIKM